jgi:predicted transcriptional regulator
MTAKQFCAALKSLGISKNGAADLIGVSRSTVYLYANGTSEVPEVVAKLLEMYLRHGVPK